MNSQITRSTPWEQLQSIPDLGLDLLGRPPLKDFDFSGEPVRKLNVPEFIAFEFIEAFALDQPPDWKHRETKPISSRILLRIQLPVPLPVSFERSPPSKILLGFFNTPLLTALETEPRVSAALNAIARRRLYVARFSAVDGEAFDTETIEQFARDFDVCVVKSESVVDRDTESQTFSLKILKSQWTPEREAHVRAGLEALFEDTKLCLCRNCQCLFSPSDGSECVVYTQGGRQVAFPGPGCIERNLGAHVADPTGGNSSLTFDDQAVFAAS
jgi:hypothetical protein